jgi:hypothetical protein
MIIVNIFIATAIFILVGICYYAYYFQFENGQRFEEPPDPESEEMYGVLYAHHDATGTSRHIEEKERPTLFRL